jgi:hypothetical protein
MRRNKYILISIFAIVRQKGGLSRGGNDHYCKIPSIGRVVAQNKGRRMAQRVEKRIATEDVLLYECAHFWSTSEYVRLGTGFLKVRARMRLHKRQKTRY